MKNDTTDAAVGALPSAVVPSTAAPATSGDAATDAAIATWFEKHFHGRGAVEPVALYNLNHTAKEDLLHVLSQL